MAYDEGLAERIRGLLDERLDIAEKRMFGGIAFMVRGHMAIGIVKDDLMVRVGPDSYEALVKQPHARRMDFTGRPMKGFVFVASAGLEADAALREWVEHGVRYAAFASGEGPFREGGDREGPEATEECASACRIESEGITVTLLGWALAGTLLGPPTPEAAASSSSR